MTAIDIDRTVHTFYITFFLCVAYKAVKSKVTIYIVCAVNKKDLCSPHLPVTPAQLMWPGIDRNASWAVGDFA